MRKLYFNINQKIGFVFMFQLLIVSVGSIAVDYWYDNRALTPVLDQITNFVFSALLVPVIKYIFPDDGEINLFYPLLCICLLISIVQVIYILQAWGIAIPMSSVNRIYLLTATICGWAFQIAISLIIRL